MYIHTSQLTEMSAKSSDVKNSPSSDHQAKAPPTHGETACLPPNGLLLLSYEEEKQVTDVLTGYEYVLTSA